MESITVPRVDILGVGVHALNMESAVDILDDAATNGTKGYVTVTGVHGIMEAQDDPSFKHVLNSSLLTTPDGMPTVWIGRSRGFKKMGRVYGPELMLEVCRRSLQAGHTHFIYGGANAFPPLFAMQNGAPDQLSHRAGSLLTNGQGLLDISSA